MDNQEPLTPEEYALLLKLGGQNTDLLNMVQDQRAQADALRTSAPQMRNAGRLQVAPHWMELVGGLAQAKTSGDLRKSAMEKSVAMRQNTDQQNRMIMQGILNRGQGRAAPAVPAAQDPYARFRIPGGSA